MVRPDQKTLKVFFEEFVGGATNSAANLYADYFGDILGDNEIAALSEHIRTFFADKFTPEELED